MGLEGFEGKVSNVIVLDEPDAEASPMHSEASDSASESDCEDYLSSGKLAEQGLLGTLGAVRRRGSFAILRSPSSCGHSAPQSTPW